MRGHRADHLCHRPFRSHRGVERRILDGHTLEAVMSMPIELFHNSKTTVVTCIMVFTAKQPHPTGKKTWFGYWRDDGYVKTKHRGRIDAFDRWTTIRNIWVSTYRSREVVPGVSVLQEVKRDSEWCAEAYLDVDYEAVSESELLTATKRLLLHQVMTINEPSVMEGMDGD